MFHRQFFAVSKIKHYKRDTSFVDPKVWIKGLYQQNRNEFIDSYVIIRRIFSMIHNFSVWLKISFDSGEINRIYTKKHAVIKVSKDKTCIGLIGARIIFLHMLYLIPL